MVDLMDPITSPFENSILKLNQEKGKTSLTPFKKRAFARFQELGLPSRKVESYQYVPLRKIYAMDLGVAQEQMPSKSAGSEWAYEETQKRLLVFYNGRYLPELSNKEAIEEGIVIQSLEKELGSYTSFFNNRLEKWIKNEKDPFALLNASLAESGIFIYVPPKMKLEKSIEILHLFDNGSEKALLSPRTHIVLGQEAEAVFNVRAISLTPVEFFSNGLIDISLDKGALGTVTFENWNLPESSVYFNTVRATLKRDANLKTLAFTDGCLAERDDYHVILEGENSEASLYKAWMTSGTLQTHSHILMEHVAPNCRSQQLFKGAVKDRSRSSFEGKVYVHPEAQKTDAYQLNNNLVLSKGAIADSKPNLEIFADDVKASHGATVGSLDEEPLIYLQTRGLPKKEAQSLMIRAFFKEITDLFPQNSLKELLEDHTLSYIKQHEDIDHE